MWTQADRDLYKDDGRSYPSDLTDAQWELIALLLSSYDPLKVESRWPSLWPWAVFWVSALPALPPWRWCPRFSE